MCVCVSSLACLLYKGDVAHVLLSCAPLFPLAGLTPPLAEGAIASHCTCSTIHRQHSNERLHSHCRHRFGIAIDTSHSHDRQAWWRC